MTWFVEKRLANRKTDSHVQETLLHIFRPHHPRLLRTHRAVGGCPVAQRTVLHRHTGMANTRHVTMSHATIVIFEY